MTHGQFAHWYKEARDKGQSHDFALYYVVSMYERSARPEAGPIGWINVKDRLPQEGEPVLCIEPGAAWGDEKPEFHVTHFSIYRGGVFQIDRPTPYCNPIYWMELPAFPSPLGPKS